MAVDATLAKGTRLYSDTASDYGTASELSDLKSIGAVGQPERPKVDATPLYSATETAREFHNGMAVYGEFTFKQYWNKTRYALLKGYFDNNTLIYWRLRYPDNATVALASKSDFRGRILKLDDGEKDDVDGLLLISVTVQISGTPTFTQGS